MYIWNIEKVPKYWSTNLNTIFILIDASEAWKYTFIIIWEFWYPTEVVLQYSARNSYFSSSHMPDMQQKITKLNSKVYGITPVKLCRYQPLYLILNTTLHLNFIIQIHAKCVTWQMKLCTITLTSTHNMTKLQQNTVTKPWNMISEWADSDRYFSFWTLSGFAYTHVRY